MGRFAAVVSECCRTGVPRVCVELRDYSMLKRLVTSVRMRYRNLRRSVSPKSITVRLPWGSRICVDPSEYVGNEIMHEQFSRGHVAVLSALLEPGMHFVDIGANIGFFTLLAAERVGSRGWVSAVEPIPAIAVELRKNCERNHLTNVAIVEAVISDNEGTADLCVGDDRNRGTSSLSTPVNFSGVKRKCRSLTLDRIAACFGRPIDIMKIDVEGAEPLVLRGGQATLNAGPIVLFESSPECLARLAFTAGTLRNAFVDCGYTLLRIVDDHTPLRPVVEEDWGQEMDVLAYSPKHLRSTSTMVLNRITSR